MNGYRLLRAVPVLVLLLSIAGCATLSPYPEPPRVSLVSIVPLEMTLLEQRYGLTLRIMNPNDTDLPLSGLEYGVELNERDFAWGVSRQDVTIPAWGEAILEVEVVSNLLDMMRQLQQLDEAGADHLHWRLTGRLGVANSALRIPFDYHGELAWSAEPAAAP